MLACALPVALAMTALHFVLTTGVAPWTEPRFAAWWETVEAAARVAEGRPPESAGLPRVWLRAGDTVIAAERDEHDPPRLRDLTFLQLAADAAVPRRIADRSAGLVNSDHRADPALTLWSSTHELPSTAAKASNVK